MKRNILLGFALLVAFTAAFGRETSAKALAPIPILITVSGEVYEALLEQGETTTKFMEMLPTTVEMQNTNNREMRYNLSTTLPSKGAKRSAYEVGDIAYLAASRSLVIFYKQDGGSIDNLQYLGRFSTPADAEVFERFAEKVEVTFELDTGKP